MQEIIKTGGRWGAAEMKACRSIIVLNFLPLGQTVWASVGQMLNNKTLLSHLYYQAKLGHF